MISLCSDWEFTREWNAGFCHGEGRFPCVSLPHTAGEVPLHYAKPEDYGYFYPCGVCRQVMMEFCNPKTFRILTAKSADDFTSFTLEEILPHGFGPEDLNY